MPGLSPLVNGSHHKNRHLWRFLWWHTTATLSELRGVGEINRRIKNKPLLSPFTVVKY